MRTFLAAILGSAILLAGQAIAFAQPAPGTILTGALGSELDAKTAYVGEDVSLNNVSSSDGSIRDAVLTGTVINVVSPGQGRNAQIGMRFHYLHLPDGTTYNVDGVVQSMQSNTKSNALKEAGGAVAGMLAGNAIAKTVLGVSGGGLVGAVGGFLVAHNNKADLVVPTNAAVSVRLVSGRRQAY